MDNTGIEMKLAQIEGKVDELQATIKSMRFYSRLTFWVSAVLIVGPLLLLPIAIPFFLSSLSLPSENGSGNGTSVSASDISSLLSSLGI